MKWRETPPINKGTNPPIIMTSLLRWLLYTILLSLRFFGAIYSLPGYIHPDEFFQGGQELFFGCQRHDIPPLGINSGVGVAERIESVKEYLVSNVPWEFEPNNALRSIIPPTFMTLVPLRLYVMIRDVLVSPLPPRTSYTKLTPETTASLQYPPQSSILWTSSMNSLSGKEILIIPRIFMAILSVIFFDGCLWILVACTDASSATKHGNTQNYGSFLSSAMAYVNRLGPPIEVLVLASSWPCLVFGVRPFTNNLEAMVLSCLLTSVCLDLTKSGDSLQQKGGVQRQQTSIKSTILVGAVCSIGLFVRFTFAFFAFPVVIAYLYTRWMSMKFQFKYFLRDALGLAISFSLTSAMFIWVDSRYYSWQAHTVYRDEVCEGATAWSYIAPFNALRYNSKSTNLAEHGLHPRVTHAVVNMPMLFGSLALAGYYSIFQRNGRTYNNISLSIIGSAYLSGLFLLSCAPHQEPRFILPCLVPLVQLYGKDAVGVNATTQQRPKVALFLGSFWVVFNLILYIFFGWLHQGGLVNSLFEMPRPTNESRTARVYVYYKTYMPPSFLARENDNSYNTNAEVCKIDEKGTSEQTLSTEVAVQLDSIVNDSLVQSCRDDIVLDLKGAESSILSEVLRKLLHCPSNTDYQSEIPIYVVSPPSVALSLEFSLYTMQRKYGYPSHISTEDWPTWSGSVGRFIDQLELAVYEVSCSMK